MTENAAARAELEDILARLDETKGDFVGAIENAPPDAFSATNADGESLKSTLERTVDDLNFYYGRLAARVLKLPQPPCLIRADFGSVREAIMSLHVAHRRFTNLLHDLLPSDLDRTAEDPELGSLTLRQVLEMAIAQYTLRSQQVARFSPQ